MKLNKTVAWLVVVVQAVAVSVAVADQASWYGNEMRGQRMANGRPFNPDRLTAASWFYPLGTKVVVAHEGRSVVVEITDRGPTKRLVKAGRIIDLSRAAFAKLASPDVGVIDVKVTPLPNRATESRDRVD
jgi:rare lipoprotein A